MKHFIKKKDILIKVINKKVILDKLKKKKYIYKKQSYNEWFNKMLLDNKDNEIFLL